MRALIREFIVARNPDARSTLPYLLQVPIEDGPIWLKAKETWPRTARVFCHQVDAPHASVEILQRVQATFCKRSGPSIDLVLARALNKRSQFVFVSKEGRPLIFWQTAKTAKMARPGLRVPRNRAIGAPAIYVDSRERYGYSFLQYGSMVERRPLPIGDYAIVVKNRTIVVVERKTISDLATSLANGSLMFAMAELCTIPVAAVAVEGGYSSLLRHKYTGKEFLADVLTRLQVRYPQVSIQFLETKKLAEDWTYRFLRGAYENASEMSLPQIDTTRVDDRP